MKGSQVILKVTRKKSAEIDKKALGKRTIKWSVSKQILLPAIGTIHSLRRKNTKVLLPEKKDQGWNLTESSETDPNKTHDILKLGIGWHCLTNAVGIISTAIQIKLDLYLTRFNNLTRTV